MLLTKDQAASTWCPMVRIARVEPVIVKQPDGSTIESQVAFSTVAGCNTDALGGLRVPASCRCIADGCAMWRWAQFDETQQRKIEEVGNLRRETTETIKVPVAGFCGLAGRPA